MAYDPVARPNEPCRRGITTRHGMGPSRSSALSDIAKLPVTAFASSQHHRSHEKPQPDVLIGRFKH